MPTPRTSKTDYSLSIRVVPRIFEETEKRVGLIKDTIKTKMDPIVRSASRFAIPALIGAGLVQSSIYDVRGGTRAVIFDRLQGVKEGVINEGTHFLVPWLQRSIHFDVRTKPRNIATTTGSKDLQMVSLTLRVLHRPEVKALPKIYQV